MASRECGLSFPPDHMVCSWHILGDVICHLDLLRVQPRVAGPVGQASVLVGRAHVLPEMVMHLPPLFFSLAVGDHTDDAYDQQSHTDAGNCQDSLLVQLLSLCGGRAGTEPMEMRIHNLPIPKPRAPSAQDLPASFHPAPYLFSDCLCLPSDFHYTWSPPPLKPIPAQCT